MSEFVQLWIAYLISLALVLRFALPAILQVLHAKIIAIKRKVTEHTVLIESLQNDIKACESDLQKAVLEYEGWLESVGYKLDPPSALPHSRSVAKLDVDKALIAIMLRRLSVEWEPRPPSQKEINDVLGLI